MALTSHKPVWLLVWTILIGIAGCQREDPVIRQLREENPFLHPSAGGDSSIQEPAPEEGPREILLLTCRYVTMELPGQIRLDQHPLIKPYLLSAQADPAAIKFQAEQIKRCEDNGLKLAMLPSEQWQPFYESLKAMGGEPVTSRMVFFRNAREAAQINTCRLDGNRSLFLREPDDSLRGYTLTPGQCFFRLHCLPGASGSDQEYYFKLLPVFQYDQARSVPAVGQGVAAERDPQFPFDELTVEATLPNDFFLVLVCDLENTTSNHLGRVFLSHEQGRENTQIVLMLAGQIRTATEKESYSTEPIQRP